MTKAKKSEVVEVEAVEIKDVDFGECELTIAKPKLDENKTMIISGNFEELKEKVTAVVEKYKGIKLTEDNVNYVKTINSHFVSLRNSIDRERKEWKKVYITPASKTIDAMCDDLQQLVAEGEQALKKQLDEYDMKRKNELTVILNDYVDEFATKYNLREEYRNQMQLLEKYYNKTQKEEDSIADIERQAKELQSKQKDYDTGVLLIKEECGEELLPDAYIRELQYKSAMEIILEIKQDKKSRKEMMTKAESGETVTIGKELDDCLAKAQSMDSLEEYRERTLKIRYKAEQAKLMTDFFKKNDIQFKFI